MQAAHHRARKKAAREVWRLLRPLAQPVRLELAIAAVAQVWLMIFLAIRFEPAARQNPVLVQLGLGRSLLLSAVVAMGLISCSVALGELFGSRSERLEQLGSVPPSTSPPDLPAFGTTGAFVLALLSVLVTVGAAVGLGVKSALVAVVTVAVLLFYRLSRRLLPTVAVAGPAVLCMLLMLVPNPQMSFAWPILVALSHALVVAALCYGLRARRPRLTAMDGWILCGIWAFLTLLMIGLMERRHAALAMTIGHLPRWIWLGPIVALVAFTIIGTVMLHDKWRPGRPRHQAAGRFARLAVLWLIVYDATWLLSAQCYWQGLVMVGLLVLAGVAGFAADRLGVLLGPGVGYHINPEALR